MKPYRCTVCGKVAYPSQAKAKQHAIRRESRFHGRLTRMRTYYSEACGYWHLTSQRP